MTVADEDEQADLAAYVLGLGDAEEGESFKKILRGAPELEGELADVERALMAAVDLVPPRAPPSRLRARLMATLEGTERYAPFMERLASIFDLSVAAMRDTILLVQDGPWTPTDSPGVSFVHFEPGPSLAGVDAGLVRFEPHATFPMHSHLGREFTFVLEGELRLSTGEVLKPGHDLLVGPDAMHAVKAGDTPLIYATFHEGMHLIESED